MPRDVGSEKPQTGEYLIVRYGGCRLLVAAQHNNKATQKQLLKRLLGKTFG